MNKQNIAVLRKIIYAVESGGQIYGKADYSCFIGAGANNSNETAITIGAGQWYADEAKELLYRIQRMNPALFKKMDTGHSRKSAGTFGNIRMQNQEPPVEAALII